MRKKLLLPLLAIIVGVFASNAAALKITVDKAANVTVTGANGTGEKLTLTDGENNFNVDTSQNPFLVEATTGAELVSVVCNDNPVSIYGGARFGVGGPLTEVVITTKGDGSSSEPVVNYVNFSIWTTGEGITGEPFTAYVEKDGAWTSLEAGDWGLPYKAPQGARMKIVPDEPYEVESITIQGSTTPLELTRQDDGSVIFINSINDYYAYNLKLKPGANALTFSISVDYPGNLVAMMEYERKGEHPYDVLKLNSGVNTIITTKSANPLELTAVDGGEILQVLLNGEITQPIGWGGTNGYVLNVESGDNIVVSTKGPVIEMDVNVDTRSSSAKLQDYFFTLGDGTVIKLEGTADKLKGNQGDYVYVSGRPGTDYSMLMGNGGAEVASDWMSWFRISPAPTSVTLYGSRNVTGVLVDVDDAARVSVVQEGGRGDALTLQNGKNQYALNNIKNSLAFSATAGNQLLSVTVNGDRVNANGQGLYLVNAAEGDYIQVRSRKAPTDFNMTFSLKDNMDVKALSLKVNGKAVESVSPLTVKTYDTVTLSAAPGYTLDGVYCSESTLKITEIDGIYELVPTDASVTAATVAIAVKEMEPSEGNAIVIPNGDPLQLKYTELRYIADEDRYAQVKVLDNNTVNEVALGNYVQVYRKDSQTLYRYVTVNGTAIEDLSSRAIRIKIEGRTQIDAEVYAPTYVHTQNTFDSEKHIVSGTLSFEFKGQQVKSFYAEPGDVVKIIPQPEPGYIFKRIEFFYPLTPAADGVVIEGDTYTFTEEDCKNEFLLFLGVFEPDENKPTYVVRGSTAFIANADGTVTTGSSTVAGSVVILQGDGTYASEFIGFEGDEVHLEIAVDNQDAFEKYEVAGFSLLQGFPNNLVPATYTIKSGDADESNNIWIYGIIKEKSGVEGVTVGNFNYDAATRTVTSADAIKVYGANGVQVVDAPAGEASLGSLPTGLYIIVSGSNTLKIAL